MNHLGDHGASSLESEGIASCCYSIALVFRLAVRQRRLAPFRYSSCFSHHLTDQRRMIDAFAIASLLQLNLRSCLKEKCYWNSV
jgi:hypothetical protein